jgi:hypothetical protein
MLPPEFDLRKQIALTISDVLDSHSIQENITWEDIAVTSNIITDGAASAQKLSLAIINMLWPSVHHADVYHYTSRSAADSILSSNRFRLTNIGSRIAEGEIKTFCEAHQLTGYLASSNGQPNYRMLIEPNTYYASFTAVDRDDTEEHSFWQSFGPVRLRLTIAAQNPDFRRVYYEVTPGEPIPVLRAMAERIWKDYGRQWILGGVSRICSYYLAESRFGWEKEMRMLSRVWDGCPVQPTGTGPASYVELVLGEISPFGFKLSVTEVCSEERLNVPEGVQFVRRTK